MTPDSASPSSVAVSSWPAPAELLDLLSPYERSFFAGEFGGICTPEYYRERLARLGFTGHEQVLDAGCGMGQWSLALAAGNRVVTGVDVNVGRLLVAHRMARELGSRNLGFRYARIEDLPFPAGSFDAIFCYSVFMFTDMRGTLAEFARVLRPGGRVYLNVNSLGWYLHLVIDRGLVARQWGVLAQAGRALVRTATGRRSGVVVSPARLVRMLGRQGFSIEGIGPEGSVGRSGAGELPAKYPPRFYGLPAVTEVVAVRDGPAPARSARVGS